MSPRLRDSLADETDPEESGLTSNNLVRLVRHYWGNYDYVPPSDRVVMDNVLPGRRLEWQEDNWSSFLAFLGLYTPKDGQSNIVVDPNEGIPISFENEPPASIRREQTLLARFLSPEYNPSGVKVRLSLLPYEVLGHQQSSSQDFELILPPNASISTLRDVVSVASASDAMQKVKSHFPGANILDNVDQNIDCNGTYRCALDFISVSEDETSDGDNTQAFTDSETPSTSPLDDTSKFILRNTPSQSSWSFVPSANNTADNKMKSPSGLEVSSESSMPSRTSEHDVNSARIEQLKYQISMLQNELKDPSCMRDRGKLLLFFVFISFKPITGTHSPYTQSCRSHFSFSDDMYAELRAANQELKKFKPWWRRLMG